MNYYSIILNPNSSELLILRGILWKYSFMSVVFVSYYYFLVIFLTLVVFCFVFSRYFLSMNDMP